MGSLATDFESLYLKTGAQGFSAAGTATHDNNSHARSQSRLPGPEPLTAFPKKPTPFIVGKPTENVSATGSDLSFKSRMAHHYAIEKKSSHQEQQRLAAAAIHRTITRYIQERREKEAKEKEDDDRAREKAERLKQSQERFRQLVRSGAQAVCAETGRVRSSLISDTNPHMAETVTVVRQQPSVLNEGDIFGNEEADLLSFANSLNADQFERDLENRALSAQIPIRNHRHSASHTDDNGQYRAVRENEENHILFYDNDRLYDEPDTRGMLGNADAAMLAYNTDADAHADTHADDDEDAERERRWEELRRRVGTAHPRPGGVPSLTGGPKDTHCPKCGKQYNPAMFNGVPSHTSGSYPHSSTSNHPSDRKVGPVQDNLPSIDEGDEHADASDGAATERESIHAGEMYTPQENANASKEDTTEYCNCPPIWLSQPSLPRGYSESYSRPQNRPMGYGTSAEFDTNIGLMSDANQDDPDAHYSDKDIAARALEESEALQRVHSQQSMTFVVKQTLEHGDEGQLGNIGSTARYLSNTARTQMLSRTAFLPTEQVYNGPRITVCEGRAEAWQKVTQSVAKLPYQRPHPSV